MKTKLLRRLRKRARKELKIVTIFDGDYHFTWYVLRYYGSYDILDGTPIWIRRSRYYDRAVENAHRVRNFLITNVYMRELRLRKDERLKKVKEALSQKRSKYDS